MKNLFQNQFSCDLMVWECNPVKRNINNEIKFYVDEKQDINKEDVIIGNYTPEMCSTYEILEVSERIKGAINKKDYVTAIVKHSFKKPIFSEYSLLVNSRFMNLYDIR